MMDLKNEKIPKKTEDKNFCERQGIGYKGITDPDNSSYIENILRFMNWDKPCKVVKKRLFDLGVTEAWNGELMKRIIM